MAGIEQEVWTTACIAKRKTAPRWVPEARKRDGEDEADAATKTGNQPEDEAEGGAKDKRGQVR